jgi:hypothetical protein
MDSIRSSRPNREAESDAELTRPETLGLFSLDGADGPTDPENGSTDRQAHSTNGAGPVHPLGPGGTDGAEPEADPFDLNSLRISQDFATAVGVKRLIKTVPIKKPSKEWFVRTHPDPTYRLETAVLELKALLSGIEKVLNLN